MIPIKDTICLFIILFANMFIWMQGKYSILIPNISFIKRVLFGVI